MMAAMDLPVTFDDVVAASQRIAGAARHTPVLTSRHVDARAGCRVFFKPENLQRMGAFKFRGAFNAIAAMEPELRSRGVAAYSSGNHAQAVALAAAEHGIPAVIVMPADAPRVKAEATRGYGGEILFYDRLTQNREAMAKALAEERGLTIIPPFDHADVIAGQGTAAKELIDDAGPLDFLFVCVGGGGLLSGCALAARALAPNAKVIGVEPAGADDVARSFASKTLQVCDEPKTIADGARTRSLGTLTFPLVLGLVDDVITVDDDAILDAMWFAMERMKTVVEPTGALALAGLFSGKVTVPAGARVGVIISGGNTDVRAFRPG